MGNSCININDKDFQDRAKKFDISPEYLEDIYYNYRKETNQEEGIPSDDYIDSKLKPESTEFFKETLSTATRIWEQKYKEPKTFSTKEEAFEYLENCPFEYKIITTNDGNFRVVIGEPVINYEQELNDIKEKAIAYGTFMKAPNGNPTNLTERQWLQVRTKAFKDWFGDWENDLANASKVVDENGEPLVLYHGGAPNIEVFKVGSPETTNTGYGAYTEEKTGRQIPVDSARTMFFSNNPFVGRSYAQLYALNYFRDLRQKVENMIGNLHDNKAGFSKEHFKSFDEFYDFLTIISEYNPRFAKLRDYIKELQQKGEKLKPNEIAAARQLFIDLRSTLSEYTQAWNLSSSEWDNILTVGKSIIKEYLGGKYFGDNIYRLMRGEIPEYMRKEWELFTKIRNHREKYGLPQIGNYDEVHVWLSSGQSVTDSDYMLKYNGKELLFDETRGKRNVPVSQMSYDEIEQFLQMAGYANKYSFWERDIDEVKQAFREKSGYYPVFLNIRNPFEHDYEGTHMGQGYKQNPKFSFGYVAARQVDKAIKNGNDGVIYRNIYDPYLADNYGVFNANQIKSATDNIGSFSNENDNIRHNRNLQTTFFKYLDALERYKKEKGSLNRYTISDFNKKYGTNFGLNPRTGEVTYKDARIDGVSIYNARDTRIVAKKRIDRLELLNYLGDKFNLRFKEVSPLEYNHKIGKLSNCCVIGGTVYIRQNDLSRLTDEQLIEEFLHPVINALYKENKDVVSKLLKEAERLFPDLCAQIRVAYKNQSKQVQEEEIITQVLSKYLNREISDNKPNSRNLINYIEQLIDKILSMFRDIFGDVHIEKGDKITISGKDIKEVFSFQNLAELINSKEIRFNDKLDNGDKRDNLNTDNTQQQELQKHLVNKRQYRAITESNIISDYDITILGNKTAKWLVHKLSYFMANPEEAFNSFVSGEYTEQEKTEWIDRASNASMPELIRLIGADVLVNWTAENLFNVDVNPNLSNNESLTRRDIKKAKLLKDNIGIILKRANAVFLDRGFSLVVDSLGKLEVNEELNPDSDNFNDSESDEEVVERGEDLREHYSIESRTRDVLGELSPALHEALDNCYELDENGDPIMDVFGLPNQKNKREVVQTILRAVDGSTSLSRMTQLLEKKAEKETWLQPIIDRLKDTSGDNSDFQSQFYTVMKRHTQPYSNIKKERVKDGFKTVTKYKILPINTNMVNRDVLNNIISQFKLGEHWLLALDGVNKEHYNTFKSYIADLQEINKIPKDERDLSQVSEILNAILKSIGAFTVDDSIIQAVAKNGDLSQILSALNNIVTSLDKAIVSSEQKWDPFDFYNKNSIRGNVKKLLTPFTDLMEDTAVSSFYENEKMYQTYTIPSFLTNLVEKFKLKGEDFHNFIMQYYGGSEWFKNQNGAIDKASSWRNPWLSLIMSDSKYKDMFDHKVELNFNKHAYMREMTDTEYIISLLVEFANGSATPSNSESTAWYRTIMMSNKPSLEYIKFVKYTGLGYQDILTNGFLKILNQELSRIQTVRQRNLSKDDPKYITNWDENGKMFNLLTFFNKYLDGELKNSEFGKLLNDKLNGNEVNEVQFNTSVKKIIKEEINNRAKDVIVRWRNKGVLNDIVGKIPGVTKGNVEDFVRNFIWNDTFASMNIAELTITDPAFYKNSEDLQKRYAQVHSPGIRPNVEATDYNGNRVSDGVYRSVVLKDFDEVKSNIIENLRIVFNRELDKFAKTNPSPEALAVKKDYYDSIIAQYEAINVTDAQAYTSMTGYRKKAIMFGKWSREKEELYNAIRQNKYGFDNNYFSNLRSVFGQVLKPFVYGTSMVEVGDENSPIRTVPKPIQQKDSEYLLIMADAILQGEDTDHPNLLRALSEVMEESAEKHPKAGIDTIVFESGVKSGLNGAISVREFVDKEGGYENFKKELKDNIYTTREVEDANGQITEVQTDDYNLDSVHQLDFEFYCIQQEVPPHFRNHKQLMGSQIRYMIMSDLMDYDYLGNSVKYTFVDGDNVKELTAEELKKEYEDTITDNINKDSKSLWDEINFNATESDDPALARNLAISRILQNEILSSPRYGMDLWYACGLDETGNFNIPLGDPIQAKRIEQLLNSIVKNNINKQEIDGGPVVQVTNFGTSRKLNIRFNSKEGGLLMTRDEWEAEKVKSPTEDTYEDYVEKNQAGIAYYEVYASLPSNDLFNLFADKNGVIDIKAVERANPELLEMIGYRIPTEDKYSSAPLKIVGFLPKEAGEGIMLPAEITTITGSDFDVDKFFLMRKHFNFKTKNKKEVAEHLRNFIESKYQKETGRQLRYPIRRKLGEEVEMFLNNPSEMRKSSQLQEDLWKEYITNVVEITKPTTGKEYRNNKIFDMMMSVLTHETTTSKILNPGGFDQQKRMGYLVEAKRQNPDLEYSDLQKMSISELKKLAYKKRDLFNVDDQVNYYENNKVAGQTLGSFAVQKTAHAVYQGDHMIYIPHFNIRFGRYNFGAFDQIEIDPTFDADGNYIGKVLGSLVASAADAVKDPVLNLMNINTTTTPLLTSLIRIGVTFEDAALLMSQKVVKDLINKQALNALTKFSTFSEIIQDELNSLQLDKTKLDDENLTNDELVKGLTDPTDEIKYKTLRLLQNVIKLKDAVKKLTLVSRLNSMSSAVGPQIVDNIISDNNINDINNDSEDGEFVIEEVSLLDEIFKKHPILEAFYNSKVIAKELLKDLPLSSNEFIRLININPSLASVFLKDRSILSKFGDFFQSYMMLQSGVIPSKINGKSALDYCVNDFPKVFLNEASKFKDNALIKAIRCVYDKNSGKAVLKLEVTGMDQTQKETLTSAWADLYKNEDSRKLATELFYYNFFRGGITFNPKTFMSLLPTVMKEQLPGYKETFQHTPSIANAGYLLDQFIRNNSDIVKLVPNFTKSEDLEKNGIIAGENNILSLTENSEFKMPYFKYNNVLYRQSRENPTIYKPVSTLGSDKAYLEISLDYISAPISSVPVNYGESTTPSNGIQEVDLNNDPITPNTTTENLQIALEVLNFNKQLGTAQERLKKYKELSDEERSKYESNIKTNIKKTLESKGIEVNEERVNDIYNEFC